MPHYEEIYNAEKVEMLRNILLREASKGKAKDFEIFVDNFKVVSRTNDVAEFDDWEMAKRTGTQSISILLYDGSGTNRNSKHTFTFPKIADEGQSALGSLDGIINAKIADRDKDHELTRLRELIETLEGQLEDAEQYSEELQNKIHQMEADGKNRMLKVGDVGASILMGMLRNSPQGSTGKALAGLLGVDDSVPQQILGNEPTVEGAASYQRQGSGLDDLTQSRLALLQSMQHSLSEQQMHGALSILGQLTDTPQRIPLVLEFLGPETNNHE